MKNILLPIMLLVTSFLAAQDNPNLESGLKPYGSFDGGSIDNVSLTSGSLTVQIPINAYPQRGGSSLSYFLNLNSKNWSVSHFGANPRGTWTFQTQPPSMQMTSSSEVKLKVNNTVIKDPDTNEVIATEKLYYAITPDGGSHQLAKIGANNYESVDATGYKFDGSTITDGAGVRYTYSDSPISGGGATRTYDAYAVTDPSGNQITGSSLVTRTDTIGRNLPSKFGTAMSDTSNCPANATAILWNFPGPNGGNYPVKACYNSVVLATNFQGPAVWNNLPATESNGSVSMVSALVLPDASKWQFSYDNYGNLQTLTFPTGGSISYTWSTRQDCLSTPSSTDRSRWVTSRTTNALDGFPRTTTYDWSAFTTNFPPYGGVVTVTDPAGNDSVYTMPSMRMILSTIFGAMMLATFAMPMNAQVSDQAAREQTRNAVRSQLHLKPEQFLGVQRDEKLEQLLATVAGRPEGLEFIYQVSQAGDEIKANAVVHHIFTDVDPTYIVAVSPADGAVYRIHGFADSLTEFGKLMAATKVKVLSPDQAEAVADFYREVNPERRSMTRIPGLLELKQAAEWQCQAVPFDPNERDFEAWWKHAKFLYSGASFKQTAVRSDSGYAVEWIVLSSPGAGLCGGAALRARLEVGSDGQVGKLSFVPLAKP